MKQVTKSSVLAIVAVVFVAGLNSACATTWVKRAANLSAKGPTPALLAGLSAHTELEGETDLIALMQNSNIGEFGEKSTSKILELMEHKGFALSLDKSRSLQLDTLRTGDNKVMQALTGSWTHPETSQMGPYVANAFLGSYDDQIVKKLRNGEGREYFAFADVTILENTGFGVGGIHFWTYPSLAVRVVVLDNAGTRVFDARGIGNGDGSPFVANRSPDNLLKALNDAIAKMEEVEVGVL